MKRCSLCHIEKSLTEFYRDRRQPDGYSYQCKACRTQYEKKRNAELRWKRYASPEQIKVKMLRRRYQLTTEEYDQRIAKQHGACKICGAVGKLVVDHKHDKTKRVRGLLCQNCNLGLGAFGDDPEKLLAAVGYLHLGGQYDKTRHIVEISPCVK